MPWYERLRSLDRRIIFVLIFLGVALPLIFPIGFPVTVTPNAKHIYDFIEKNTKAGDPVILSFDYDPGSRAEVHPMAEALIEHCFRKDLRVICPALWPVGPSLAAEAFGKLAPKYDKKEGIDYVNLGYFAGPTTGDIQITAFKNLRNAYPKDVRGIKLEELPVMRGVKGLKDARCIVSLSAGDPGIPAWVRIAADRFGVKLAGGGTAVQAPQFFPFIQSKQLFGFLGGLKGAAEYETMLKIKGKGISGMDAQSVAHLVIVIFIILSNVTYFMAESRKSRRI